MTVWFGFVSTGYQTNYPVPITEVLDYSQCYTMDLGTLQFCNAFICTALRGGHSSALPMAFMRIHEERAKQEKGSTLYIAIAGF